MDVHTWRHDLVEVAYTFTLDNISHCKHITRVYIMANRFFLVYLRQGFAFSLDVKYPMLNYDEDVGLNQFIRKIIRESNN